MKTKGDRLFETFCLARGIQLAQIPEGRKKSPDFLARIGAREFIVEVKTLEPNEAEAAVIACRARGEIMAGSWRVEVRPASDFGERFGVDSI